MTQGECPSDPNDGYDAGPERWAGATDPDELASALARVRRRVREHEHTTAHLWTLAEAAPGGVEWSAAAAAGRLAPELDAARRALAEARVDEAVLSAALAAARRRAAVAGGGTAASAAALRAEDSAGVPRSVALLALLVAALVLASGGGSWILAHLPAAPTPPGRPSEPDARAAPETSRSAALPTALELPAPATPPTDVPPAATVPPPAAASAPSPAAGEPRPGPPDPTAVAALTGTAGAHVAAASLVPAPGAPLDERFADNRLGWPTESGVARLDGGTYRLAARQPGGLVAVPAPAGPARDLVLSATFRAVGGPPGGSYGLILRAGGPWPRDGRAPRGDYLLVAADARGLAGAGRVRGGRWEDLLPWARSEALRQGGAPNELAVRARGRRLEFTVNGAQVATLEDPAPRSGEVGLFAAGGAGEVAVDRVTLDVFE